MRLRAMMLVAIRFAAVLSMGLFLAEKRLQKIR
jgi:hypothetical protein